MNPWPSLQRCSTTAPEYSRNSFHLSRLLMYGSQPASAVLLLATLTKWSTKPALSLVKSVFIPLTVPSWVCLSPRKPFIRKYRGCTAGPANAMMSPRQLTRTNIKPNTVWLYPSALSIPAFFSRAASSVKYNEHCVTMARSSSLSRSKGRQLMYKPDVKTDTKRATRICDGVPCATKTSAPLKASRRQHSNTSHHHICGS
mmetsp:Transcript_13834/g.28313  ORF Transcript_13834/g.28313 Transcript_13834/m.28313 type:complete len:200 (-) Transcript_13834:775-1374(-)